MMAAVTTIPLPSLDGLLLTRGCAEYEEARCRNFALNSHDRGGATSSAGYRPSYIGVVESVDDVRKCLAYAKNAGLTVAVRTGGHNWFGCYLRDDVFLVDMSKFNSLEIDVASKTATIGPAVKGQVLNTEAAKHGLCFSAGHCVDVPLGGFLLGGGVGWFFQYYGMAVEHVLEATIVTSSGVVVTATSTDDDEWMWLVRGSGSAFPGVVVSFKIQLATLPKIVRSKTTTFPVDVYAKVIEQMNEYVVNNPDDAKKLELTVCLASTPPPVASVVDVPKVAMVSQTWMADSEEEFDALVEPLSKKLQMFESYVAGDFQDMSFRGLSEMISQAYPPGQHWIARAYMYDSSKKTTDTKWWDDVKTVFVDKAPVGLTHLLMFWCPERRSSKPACFGSYSMKGFCVLLVGAHGGGNEDAGPVQSFADTAADVLDPPVWRYDTLEHPLNKHTFRKSFPETADKLMELRSKMDPGKLFFDPTVADPSH